MLGDTQREEIIFGLYQASEGETNIFQTNDKRKWFKIIQNLK